MARYSEKTLNDHRHCRHKWEKMKSFTFLQSLFVLTLLELIKADGPNPWLFGDYDYGSAPEPEEPLFDSGPQYVAPAHGQQHFVHHAGHNQQVQVPQQQQQQYAYPAQQASVQVPQHAPLQPFPPPAPAPPPVAVQYQPQPQQIAQVQQQHQPPRVQYAPPPTPAPAPVMQQQPQVQQVQYQQQQQQQHLIQPQAPAPPVQHHRQQVQSNPHQQQQLQQGHNRLPPRLPPQQEAVFADNMVHEPEEDENKGNSWLFEGEPPAPTFSPEDERIRQQKFMQQKTTWDIDEIARQNQAHLQNREGEVVLNKAFVDRDELAYGTGKRIPNQVVVQTGGQHGLAPMNIAPVQPQQLPQAQLQPHHQPHQLHPNKQNQFQFQPDKDFAKPQGFYEGKIRPDEGTKFLKETYGIPRRENRRRLGQAHAVAEEETKRGGGVGRRSHALDDPPAEIMQDVRWFDDDEDGNGNSPLGNNIMLYEMIIALILYALLN